jgi:hypothetical protein
MKLLDKIKRTPKQNNASYPSEWHSLFFESVNPRGGEVDAGTIDSPAKFSL